MARPKINKPGNWDVIVALYTEGKLNLDSVTRLASVSRATVCRWLRDFRNKPST